MVEAVLKITKITLIVGATLSVFGMILNDIWAFGGNYTGLLAAYMGLTGSLFLACAVAAIFGLRAKEWKELKLLFLFWIVFEGLALVGNIIYATTLPADVLAENFVCYGIGLTLLIFSVFKQTKAA